MKWEIFKKPFQVKFIPTFVAIVLAAVSGGLGSAATALFWLGLAAWQTFASDAPLTKVLYFTFIVLGAVTSAYGIACFIYGAWAAGALSWGLSAFPLSILFTRKLKESTDVHEG